MGKVGSAENIPIVRVPESSGKQLQLAPRFVVEGGAGSGRRPEIHLQTLHHDTMPEEAVDILAKPSVCGQPHDLPFLALIGVEAAELGHDSEEDSQAHTGSNLRQRQEAVVGKVEEADGGALTIAVDNHDDALLERRGVDRVGRMSQLMPEGLRSPAGVPPGQHTGKFGTGKGEGSRSVSPQGPAQQVSAHRLEQCGAGEKRDERMKRRIVQHLGDPLDVRAGPGADGDDVGVRHRPFPPSREKGLHRAPRVPWARHLEAALALSVTLDGFGEHAISVTDREGGIVPSVGVSDDDLAS